MAALESINEATPVAMCTIGQLVDYLKASGLFSAESATPNSPTAISRVTPGQGSGNNSHTNNRVSSESRKIHGLKGIADEFGCSISTAQKYKKEIFAPIIIQNGHKIILDAEKAWEYYEKYNKKKISAKRQRDAES